MFNLGLVKYFPDLDISKYEWNNHPYDKNTSFTECSLEEEEELINIKSINFYFIKYNMCVYYVWLYLAN